MIAKITRAYIRRYSDNKQTTACVEWIDSNGKTGRTEAPCDQDYTFGRPYLTAGPHMDVLMVRALREGCTIERETW